VTRRVAREGAAQSSVRQRLQKSLNKVKIGASDDAYRDCASGDEGLNLYIMEHDQKSCWGVTAKAVMGFAGIILIAWLISGAETAAVIAAAG
jgi:hypothetical protein